MGIFLIMAGVLVGFVSFAVFGMANAIPQQLFAGEIAICGSMMFTSGAIIMAIDRLRESQAKQPAA